MEMFESLLDILKYTIPALIVYLVVHSLIKNFLSQQSQLKALEIKAKSQESTLTLRLQALERMSLFCERISPGNLLLRLAPDGLSVGEYRVALMLAIRQEYEHNITQQVYLSDKLWQIIKLGSDDIVSMINLAAEELDPKADARILREKLFLLLEARGATGADQAQKAIKTEAGSLF
jgi:hypothetical protein